jgi:hypothetical protein
VRRLPDAEIKVKFLCASSACNTWNRAISIVSSSVYSGALAPSEKSLELSPAYRLTNR